MNAREQRWLEQDNRRMQGLLEVQRLNNIASNAGLAERRAEPEEEEVMAAPTSSVAPGLGTAPDISKRKTGFGVLWDMLRGKLSDEDWKALHEIGANTDTAQRFAAGGESHAQHSAIQPAQDMIGLLEARRGQRKRGGMRDVGVSGPMAGLLGG